MPLEVNWYDLSENSRKRLELLARFRHFSFWDDPRETTRLVIALTKAGQKVLEEIRASEM